MTRLFKKVTANTPRVNKKIINGEVGLDNLEYELETRMKETMNILNKNIRMEFITLKRMTPDEEFKQIVGANKNRNNQNKVQVDLAKSDLYMVKLVISFEDQLIEKPLLLPFLRDRNIIYFSNTPYTINMVLTDTIITPTHKEVFLRLFITKNIIYNKTMNFVCNNELVQGKVLHSPLVKTNKTMDKLGGVNVPLALYPLHKFGLRRCLKKYGVSDVKLVKELTSDITEKYDTYTTIGTKPHGLKSSAYIAPKIHVCIPKEDKISDGGLKLIYGLIHALEIWPSYADELIKIIDVDTGTEKYIWMLLLARITYKNVSDISKMQIDIEDHLRIVDCYLDSTTRKMLKDATGKLFNDFYEVILYIFEEYDTWILSNKKYNSNIDNKYVDSNYYIGHDITYAFNKSILNINRRSTKKQITLNEINKILGDELSHRKIYDLVKSQSLNIALALAELTGDNAYIKNNATLENQSRGEGVNRGKNMTFPSTLKAMNGYDPLVGSILFLNKSCPSSLLRINIFADISNEGKFRFTKTQKYQIVHLETVVRNQNNVENEEDGAIIDEVESI